MGSITSVNPISPEPRKVRIEIKKNDGRLVLCHFCQAPARQYAVKGDGTMVPCCFNCVNPETYRKFFPWIKLLEKIPEFGHKGEKQRKEGEDGTSHRFAKNKR